MDNICDNCTWADTNKTQCNCPNLPPLWGELLTPSIANLDLLTQIGDLCTQDNLRDKSAVKLCAPIIANKTKHCPTFSPKQSNN